MSEITLTAITAETRATALDALHFRHDALTTQLYTKRLTAYAKWATFTNPARVVMARELRAVRRAIAELKVREWPQWMTTEAGALEAWQRESR